MDNAPTREIGYAQASIMSASTNSNWWMFEDEQTPELRWPQSVFVFDQMRTQDSQVKSVLQAVTLPVRRTPWRIDPAGARPEVVQLVAEDLGLPIVGKDPEPLPRTRDRFSWAEHLREALLMLPFGHMYFEQNVRIVDGKARLRKLAPRLPKTIEEIDVARDGGLVSITQYSVGSGGTQPPIPVERIVAYINEKEGGNWLGRSLLRSCYKNWLLKDRLLRVQAQTIERNGMGIPVYTAAETEKDTSSGLGLATTLRSGEAAGAALPFGAMLRLMGVEGQLPDAEPAIRYHDEQIARSLLAHFLNLGTQTGSWALGSTFADFFTLSLQTLAQQVADVATQHVVEDLVDWNWGDNEPAPKVVCDEIGSRQAATAEAIKSLIDAGVITADEVLERAVRQQYGLPPRDEATERTPPAETGPAPRTAPETQPDERPGSVAASSGDAGPKEVTAKYNPDQLRDPGGEDGGRWIKAPGSAATGALDKLKGAGRIDLEPGERLLRSDRTAGEGGRAWLAVTEKNGKRSLRIGLGNAEFGTRRDPNGPWRAAQDRSYDINEEREDIRARQEDLENEIAELENDPSVDLTERRAQLEELYNADTDEVFPNGHTAILDEQSARQLRETLAKALDDGEAMQNGFEERAARIDALEQRRNELRKIVERVFTDEEDAEWDRLTAEIEALEAQEPPRPEAGYWVLAEGSIPGQWADVHYEVYLDDPSVGVETNLGAIPEYQDPDFEELRAGGAYAQFNIAEADEFVKLLANMESGRSKPVAGRNANPGRWVQAHLPGLHPQDSHGRRFQTPGDRSSGLRPNRAEREAAQSAQELGELKQSLSRAAAAFAARSDRQAGPGATSTSTPTRMTKSAYTKVLKAELVRLHMLDGKTEKQAKALARPTATIDDLKARNTDLRKGLRRKGVDYRTEEQKRADDTEKNTLLDEVEQLAAAGGHDGAAKRASASRMTKQELRKFVDDVKDFQRRQKAKRDAPSQAAFEAVEAETRATPRQVGYIVSLLRARANSGEGGGFMSGPTATDEIRKMSKREASAYINSLRGDY